MMQECLKVTGSGLMTNIGRKLHQWFCAEPLSETEFCVFYCIGQMVLRNLAQRVSEQPQMIACTCYITYFHCVKRPDHASCCICGLTFYTFECITLRSLCRLQWPLVLWSNGINCMFWGGLVFICPAKVV